MINLAAKIGRQEVVSAYVHFDIDDFKDAAGNVLIDAIPAIALPQGACVIDGFVAIDTAFDGLTSDLFIGDDEDDVPVANRYLDAGNMTLAPSKLAVTNADGHEVGRACWITLKTSDPGATVGAGRICIRYVVSGRAAFCQE